MTEDFRIEKIKSLQKEAAKLAEGKKKKEMQARLEEMKNYFEEDRVVITADIIEELKNGVEGETFPTGFKELDFFIEGFREEQLVIVSAPPKNGKTSLVVNLMQSFRKQGLNRPLFLGLEQSAKELFRQLMRYQKFTYEDLPDIATPLRNNVADLKWIEEKIIESIAKEKSNIVIIDNFSFMVKLMQRGGNDSSFINQTVMELKRMAREYKIVMILIVHINKLQEGTMPTYHHLSGSAAFHQLCDFMIMMWKEYKKGTESKSRSEESTPEGYTGRVMISVEANRPNGKTPRLWYTFKDGHYQFLDYDNANDIAEALKG